MLYDNFFKWLFHNHRKHCEHDWIDTGWTYNSLKAFWDIGGTGFRHHWKCTKCDAKEKRTPTNPPNMILY